MSNHKALYLAIEAAQRRRDTVQCQLRDRGLEVRAAREQLEQLQAYEQQAQHRMVHQGAAWSNMETARHHYQFMERLAQAIVLQTHALQRAIHLEDDVRGLLVQTQMRVKALELLFEQRQQQLKIELFRREQRTTDEMALHAYMRRHAPQPSGETPWQ